MSDRLSQMLEDDPAGLEVPVVAPEASALDRVKALKQHSAAARSNPESDASDKDVAKQTAKSLGWKGSDAAAQEAKPKRLRRRDPNAEPKEVLYLRVPRSILNGYLQYCQDSNLTQAEGFIAMCKKHLPKSYLPGTPARHVGEE